jgi:hypothetical protein
MPFAFCKLFVITHIIPLLPISISRLWGRFGDHTIATNSLAWDQLLVLYWLTKPIVRKAWGEAVQDRAGARSDDVGP